MAPVAPWLMPYMRTVGCPHPGRSQVRRTGDNLPVEPRAVQRFEVANETARSQDRAVTGGRYRARTDDLYGVNVAL